MWKSLLVGVALLLTGCAREEPKPFPDAAFTSSPAPTASPLPADQFQSTTLPDHVTDLYGTALLSAAKELETMMRHPRPEEPDGASFVLVSSTNPQLGVLVFAGANTTGDDVARRTGGPLRISGAVKVFEDPDLARKFKDRHKIVLCSRGNSLQYVVPSGPVWPPGSAVAPEPAPGTPTPVEDMSSPFVTPPPAPDSATPAAPARDAFAPPSPTPIVTPGR